MASTEQQFAQFWASSAPRGVSLWADSSYGPLVDKDMLRIAKEMNFPLNNFTMSYDGGLTVVGCDNHGGGNLLAPDTVVLIQMGYNDDSDLRGDKVPMKMRKQKWYAKLQESRHIVKFVVFIHEPTYKMMIPPASKKQAKKFTKGTITEGSKYTSQAIQLCQEELGLQAFEMRCRCAEEFFEGMLYTTATGEAFQTENTLLWEDNVHPTATGGEVHFRSVLKAFQARYSGGAPGTFQQTGPPAMMNVGLTGASPTNPDDGPDYSNFGFTGSGAPDYSTFGGSPNAGFQQAPGQYNGQIRQPPSYQQASWGCGGQMNPAASYQQMQASWQGNQRSRPY